ncbi:MAG: Holliday junction resolvase RuvX [Flavobacteriales bacterium]|jgi:putative Holliday junction resolvase|tara:strand:- start:10541 stop:10960 length:420 start_codon:yes stop_codon:yes gene_type:complete
MNKILAIDYGSKRVGLAVTDTQQIIASGLTTVKTSDLMVYLKEYFLSNMVECVVVGHAKNLDNTLSESSKYIEPFVLRLKKAYPELRIERIDERFTSKMAFQTMIDSGISKKARSNKALVDQISATIILQSFLDSRGRG